MLQNGSVELVQGSVENGGKGVGKYNQLIKTNDNKLGMNEKDKASYCRTRRVQAEPSRTRPICSNLKKGLLYT